MRFYVGQRSIRKGSNICLSKKGTLRTCRSWQDRPIGVAVTDLHRNIIAEELEDGKGQFVNKFLYTRQQLTDVTLSYFRNNEYISKKLLP